MQVVCASCGAKNRVAETDLEKQVHCGRCKADLLPAHPVALNDGNFQPFIAGTEMPVVVDFWAPWCGPCRMMAPQFEQAAAQMRGVRFSKLDTEANPRTATTQGIRSIPTLALYAGGREVARSSGAMMAADLLRWIRDGLAGVSRP